MKHNIKLFFLDLDGTLLDEMIDGKKHMSKENLRVLSERKERGFDAAISTGRIGDQALAWLNESGLDYAVCGNGSQIIDKTGKVLMQHDIFPEQMKAIKKFIKGNGLAIKLDTTRIAYNVNGPHRQYMADKLHYELRKDIDFDDDISRVKLIIMGKDPDELPKFAGMMMNAIPGISVVSAERGWTLEVTSDKATKATGNLWAMKNLFNIEDAGVCAHIGDTMNDFPVIGTIGYFIAVEDAQKDLLKAAPYIGPSHNDHGVAHIMNGFFKENPFKK